MAKDKGGHGSEKRGGNAMPIAGHPYHTKSDAELRFIASDAHAAAQAIQGHDANAENKYRDQVNDASTVLGYRQRGGSQVQPEPAAHSEAVHSVGRLDANGQRLEGSHGVPVSRFGPDNPAHREHVGGLNAWGQTPETARSVRSQLRQARTQRSFNKSGRSLP